MKIVLRNPVTRIIERVEENIYLMPEFPPEWGNSERVIGYAWDYEVPAANCLWAYGMTEKEWTIYQTVTEEDHEPLL